MLHSYGVIDLPAKRDIDTSGVGPVVIEKESKLERGTCLVRTNVYEVSILFPTF